MNRIAFLLLFLLAALPARAQTTNVVALVTFTNVVRGVTNGDTITINGDVRRYTNGALASSAFILSTNIVGHAATNTMLRLAVYTPAFVDRIFTTNTNSLVIQGKLLSSLTVSLSSGVGTVAYSTQTWSTVYPIVGPNGGVPTEAGRTNNASQLISLLNDTRATNAVSEGVPALSNIVTRGATQTLGNKTLTNSVADYSRITNASSLHGSNATIRTFLFTGGSIVELTNLSGNIGSGSLTNGTFWSNVVNNARFTNGNFNGTVHYLTNGSWTNATLLGANTVGLNNYGSPIISQSTGPNAEAYGQLSEASGSSALAVGFSALASGATSTAIGNAAKATNDSATALGKSAIAGGSASLAAGASARATNENQISLGAGAGASATKPAPNSTVIGVASYANWPGDIILGNTASSSTAGGGNAIALGYLAMVSATNAIALGGNAESAYQNSVAIGASSATTKSNEVMLGTSSHHVAVPGVFQAAAISNLVTVSATNILRGDLSFPRFDISTVAAGHNVIDIGTNIYVRLTGSPGSDWTLGGITSGSIRDGKLLVVENRTGYSVTIQNESGTAPTAAERILTLASSGSVTNATLVGDGTMMFIYSGASARWILLKPDVDVSSTATNALTTISTNGVPVSSVATGLDFTNATGYVVGGTVFINPGVVAGSGEANYNGEVSVTNATRIGLVHSKSDVTNRLRSLSAGNGIVLTNEGTNIVIAATGGGSQTPYASDHDGAGYKVTNLVAIAFGAAAQGTEPIRIGTNVSRSVDAQILIARRMTNETSGLNTNGHAFSDSTVVARSTAGHAYNSYDVRTVFTNAAMDHNAGFQFMPDYAGGTLTNSYGAYLVPTVSAGTLRTNYGLYSGLVNNGTVPANYGIRIATPTGNAPTIDYGVMVEARHASSSSFLDFWAAHDAGRYVIGANRDVIISRDRAYTAQLWVDAAAGAGQDTELHGTDATGTDLAGGALTLSAGRNTGAGAPGALIFATSPYGSTGTASNNVVERLRIATNAIIIPSTAGLRLLGNNIASNRVWTATNATTGEGEWRAVSGGGGSVGPGALDFAATQFDTNVIVHLKAGALMTNTTHYGGVTVASGTLSAQGGAAVTGDLSLGSDGVLFYDATSDELSITNTFAQTGLRLGTAAVLSAPLVARTAIFAFTNLSSSTSNSAVIVSNALANVPSNTVHTASIAIVGAAVTTGTSNTVHPSVVLNNLPTVGGMAATFQAIVRTNLETGTIVLSASPTAFSVPGSLSVPSGNVTIGNSQSFATTSAGSLTAASGLWRFRDSGGSSGIAVGIGANNASSPALGATNGDFQVMGGNLLYAGGSTNRLIVPALTFHNNANATTITNILSATATLDFASQTLGAVEDLPITVTGAASGDAVEIGVPQGSATGIVGMFSGFASNNTVYVRFLSTGTAQDPASGTFRAVVKKFLQ